MREQGCGAIQAIGTIGYHLQADFFLLIFGVQMALGFVDAGLLWVTAFRWEGRRI